jgi:hypothetical protein
VIAANHRSRASDDHNGKAHQAEFGSARRCRRVNTSTGLAQKVT